MRYGLGRKPSPPDSRDYRLRDYMPATWPDFAHDMAFYSTGPILNQGSTPHCVGFSAAHWLNSEPVINDCDDEDGHELYYLCKVLDGEPGAENGSWVRSAAKVLKNRGRIDTYAFSDSVLEARRFILTASPVVFGIDWYEGMFYPDADAVIRPTGELCGGHAILAYGADPDYCHFVNSWSDKWGDRGRCSMKWADLEAVFANGGEAMAAVETEHGFIPSPAPWWVRLWRWFLSIIKS